MNWLYINAYMVVGVVFCLLLVGWWIHRSIGDLKNALAQPASTPGEAEPLGRDHDAQHQALLYLMTQKTDSVLAALARTIEAERQKLGMVVRKSSTDAVIDTASAPAPAPAGSENSPSPHERILPMAGSGVSVAAIARQLQLSEAEVATIVRLNAA